MTNRIFTTPEGVRDIYNGECAVKIDLQIKLRERMHLYGFQDIETPSFEYFDIFSEERGTVKAKDMYKFFDRDGNTLVLRPDMTPSIARCASKYFKDEKSPIRLCYCGHTFVNNSEYQGKQKEVTQLGCELINDPSIMADAEMLAVTVDCLLASGLKEFRIDIGDVHFFKALVSEAGLDEDKVYKLRHYIIDKNSFGIEDFLKEENVSDELKEVFAMLPKMFGGAESLDSIEKITTNKDALAAIEYLKSLRELMKAYGYDRYIGFDLGMLSKYSYYTGIIFNVFTYDIGEPIASGGRYDRLVGQFGKDAAAVGMAIVMDKLQIALSRQGLLTKKGKDIEKIVAGDDAVSAIKKAMELRESGKSCMIVME
ncbi:MAG: ATP phosphoribosyltransferase regulatory subunit [Lachnospiraceae bacterium]|nr:ATP phosphoribosyltransferase regulatory subunit [Lachnospiraceae bacterium]